MLAKICNDQKAKRDKRLPACHSGANVRASTRARVWCVPTHTQQGAEGGASCESLPALRETPTPARPVAAHLLCTIS